MTRRIVADANLALAEELFAPFGQLELLAGREIGPADVRDAEILLVRSVTRVDRQLLAGSKVRFVGSATIGTDHLDLEYLREAGIAWANAPGCNANAVVDYVCAAIGEVPELLERLQAGGRVAVVGCGNVGGRLLRRLQGAGLTVCGVDPWLQPPQPWNLVGLEQALQSDMICLHTPLTHTGLYPTRHLLNTERLAKLKPGAVLLNAGRGPVIDQSALLRRLTQGDLAAVLDVWEEEPDVPPALLEQVALGTPHIAGYSYDGKVAGSVALWQALIRKLGRKEGLQQHLPEGPELQFESGLDGNALLRAALRQAYPITADDQALRRVVAEGDTAGFDRLRRDYPLRREFAAWRMPSDLAPAQQRLLSSWGFATGLG